MFNKIFDGIKAKMADEGGAKEKLFNAACAAGAKKRELAEQGKSSILTNIKFAFLDKLVFSKIRARFGGRLQGALTASAVMNKEVGNFFYDIGIPTYDCYGLSEMNGPGVAMECVFKNGLHVWEDAYLMEIIDSQTGKRVCS